MMWQAGSFVADEAGKHTGRQQLQLHVGLLAGCPEHLQFRYYFELFGTIAIKPLAKQV